MPIFESECPACGKKQDYWATIDDRANTPECCGSKTDKVLSPTRSAVDISPYWTIAHDKETGSPEYITGRKQHRDFVRRNGLEEVGSESTIPKDAASRIEEKRYLKQELDDSVDALA